MSTYAECVFVCTHACCVDMGEYLWGYNLTTTKQYNMATCAHVWFYQHTGG